MVFSSVLNQEMHLHYSHFIFFNIYSSNHYFFLLTFSACHVLPSQVNTADHVAPSKSPSYVAYIHTRIFPFISIFLHLASFIHRFVHIVFAFAWPLATTSSFYCLRLAGNNFVCVSDVQPDFTVGRILFKFTAKMSSTCSMFGWLVKWKRQRKHKWKANVCKGIYFRMGDQKLWL